MQALIEQFTTLLPDVKFEAGEAFCWSPESRLITYRQTKEPTQFDTWAFLHEAGHALLDHTTYTSDLQLLLLEVAAWEKASELAPKHGIVIDPDHIQDCLDTYRDWLHQRSSCPTCTTTCLQITPTTYRCHNCTTEWCVTTSRFCRAYRRRALSAKEKRLPEKTPQATFI
jgi:hypothetical protein